MQACRKLQASQRQRDRARSMCRWEKRGARTKLWLAMSQPTAISSCTLTPTIGAQLARLCPRPVPVGNTSGLLLSYAGGLCIVLSPPNVFCQNICATPSKVSRPEFSERAEFAARFVPGSIICPLRTIEALETSTADLLALWAADALAIRGNWSALVPTLAGSISSRQSKSTGASGDQPRRRGRVAQWAKRQGMPPGRCVAKGGWGGGGRGGGGGGGGGGGDDGAES